MFHVCAEAVVKACCLEKHIPDSLTSSQSLARFGRWTVSVAESVTVSIKENMAALSHHLYLGAVGLKRLVDRTFQRIVPEPFIPAPSHEPTVHKHLRQTLEAMLAGNYRRMAISLDAFSHAFFREKPKASIEEINDLMTQWVRGIKDPLVKARLRQQISDPNSAITQVWTVANAVYADPHYAVQNNVGGFLRKCNQLPLILADELLGGRAARERLLAVDCLHEEIKSKPVFLQVLGAVNRHCSAEQRKGWGDWALQPATKILPAVYNGTEKLCRFFGVVAG